MKSEENKRLSSEIYQSSMMCVRPSLVLVYSYKIWQLLIRHLIFSTKGI